MDPSMEVLERFVSELLNITQYYYEWIITEAELLWNETCCGKKGEIVPVGDIKHLWI